MAYLEVLKDAYAQIAFLLRLDHEDLRLQICNTLLEVFLGTYAPVCKPSKKATEADESRRRVPVEYTRYVFEESQVADTLVRALALFESAAVINILFQVRPVKQASRKQFIMLSTERIKTEYPSSEYISKLS